MDKSTLNLLIQLAVVTILPVITASVTAWLKKRKWVPAGVRDWLGKVSDADVLAAVLEASKYANATPAERQEIARKYLQERIAGLSSSQANYFIEKKLQEVK